jgi:phage anti-repressor protein
MNNSLENIRIFSEDVIPVYDTDTGEKVVLGRELHERLKIKTAYKDWFPRMCEYGFVDGKDYGSFLSNRSDGLAGKPKTDHIITPTRMEYTISVNERNFHKASASNQAIRAGELAVTNVSKRGSGYDLRYTGQVTNNSQFTSNWIKVIVIYKMKDTEGNEVPVGGDCTYITDALPSGQTTTFELYPLSGFTGYSSYEIIALQD